MHTKGVQSCKVISPRLACQSVYGTTQLGNHYALAATRAHHCWGVRGCRETPPWFTSFQGREVFSNPEMSLSDGRRI